MSCQICGRGSCTRSFHSLSEQEAFDELDGKDDRWLKNKVIELRDEVSDLRDRLEEKESELDRFKEIAEERMEHLEREMRILEARE